MNFLFVWMLLKRKSLECADTLSPAKFHDRRIDGSFPKHFTLVIQIATFHVLVLHPIVGRILFTTIIYNAPWLASTKASRRLVGCLDEVDQEV